ncbi:MAG: futalosine hydrolase [Candidatus Latescibacterota bacterium]
MIHVLVLTATALEQDKLVAGLQDAVQQQAPGHTWRAGRLGPCRVRLVETGIGAVNAAHALTCSLQARRPRLVLLAGVGGAYPGSGLAMGDLALAETEAYGDLGVRTPAGWQPLQEVGIPLLRRGEEEFYNAFPLDPAWTGWAAAALAAAPRAAGLPPVHRGPFLTVQECSGTLALGREREERWGALCESMEGAAVAHLCRAYAVPLVEVRGISNRVEDRCRQTWDLPLAASRAQGAVLALLAALSEAPSSRQR